MNAPDNVTLFGSKTVVRASIAHPEVLLIVMQIEGVEVYTLLAFNLDYPEYLPHVDRKRFAGNRS
jgi:hypothetical protein